MDEERFISFKWNNHRNTFFHVLSVLREKAVYTDVTLACEGKFLQAHKLVISTCSDYFRDIFEKTSCISPVIVLNNIRIADLESLIDFMYLGETDVKESDVADIIRAAESLKIKGLGAPDDVNCERDMSPSTINEPHVSPPKKMKFDDNVSTKPSKLPKKRQRPNSILKVKSTANDKSKQTAKYKPTTSKHNSYPLLKQARKMAGMSSGLIRSGRPLLGKKFQNLTSKDFFSEPKKMEGREIKVTAVLSPDSKVDLMRVPINDQEKKNADSIYSCDNLKPEDEHDQDSHGLDLTSVAHGKTVDRNLVQNVTSSPESSNVMPLQGPAVAALNFDQQQSSSEKAFRITDLQVKDTDEKPDASAYDNSFSGIPLDLSECQVSVSTGNRSGQLKYSEPLKSSDMMSYNSVDGQVFGSSNRELVTTSDETATRSDVGESKRSPGIKRIKSPDGKSKREFRSPSRKVYKGPMSSNSRSYITSLSPDPEMSGRPQSTDNKIYRDSKTTSKKIFKSTGTSKKIFKSTGKGKTYKSIHEEIARVTDVMMHKYTKENEVQSANSSQQVKSEDKYIFDEDDICNSSGSSYTGSIFSHSCDSVSSVGIPLNTAGAKMAEHLDDTRSLGSSELSVKLDDITLPEFSQKIQPYLSGNQISENDLKDLRNLLADELANHFRNHSVVCSTTIRKKFYKALEKLILEKYPNIILEKSKRRASKLGILFDRMASRWRPRSRISKSDQSPVESHERD